VIHPCCGKWVRSEGVGCRRFVAGDVLTREEKGNFRRNRFLFSFFND